MWQLPFGVQLIIKMGVQSLWQLLLPIAKRLTLDDLRGHTLAIDASIWMVKVQSIYSRLDQMLLSIFNKIIMLLKSGIRPVFVFDGQTPDLKRACLERRRRSALQIADNQIKRKAQLEIVRLMKGEGKRENREDGEADEKKKKFQQEELEEVLDEVDLMKLELYSQRLNQQYSMLLNLNPHLAPDYSMQTYQTLSIPQRQQILKSYKARANFLRNQKFKQKKQQKASEKSYRQAFMQDIKRITKSAELTKMRHNHYLQVMAKASTTENKDGMEIARGRYGNSMFEMRRKEGEKKSRYEKKEVSTKNNFNQIMKRKVETSQEEDQLPEPNRTEDDDQKKPDIDISDLLKRLEHKEVIREEQDISQQKTIEEVKKPELQEDCDDEYFNDEPEEVAHVNLRIDINKLIQARNSTQTPSQQQPQAAQTQPSVVSPSQPQPELPDHLTSYTAPPQPSPFIDNIELKSLLDLLGLPYVNAPYEAEAQCAQLQMSGLVDGIVTEDSDTFLFGGRHVYRGVFQNQVKFYNMDRIKREIGMDREKCVIFAMFLGSDYTEGVKGVGIVNAMEILRVFDTVSRLHKLRDWARLPDQLVEFHSYKGCTSEEIQFFEFHKNFKKYWYLDEDFPNQRVVDGYLKPQVDQVKDKIKFKQPDLVMIQRLLKEKFQMRDIEAKNILDIIDKTYKEYTLNRKPTIKDYFARVDTVPCAIIKSKRLNKALGKDSK